MAYENKTKATQASVTGFIDAIDNETRRDDAHRLVEIFQKQTGFEPYMYGPTIIGFGKYHYKYASGHEGDAPLAAFSPRKDSLVLYFATEFEGREDYLEKLGKHKIGKSCVYVKKLADIDESVLPPMIDASVSHMKKLYP